MSSPQLTKMFSVALAAQRRGDAKGAVRAFEAILGQEPGNPKASNSLGMIALETGDFQRAEKLFARAAKADPREPALWVNVAKAQRLQGDDAGERASLEAALAIDQRHFMALLRKAELHERLNERANAALAWQGVVMLGAQAGDLPPGVHEAVQHGQAYLDQHRGALSAALDKGLAGARDGLSRAELRRFDACVDTMLGKRRIYANECHGVHFPFLPAHEFFDRDFFPWMAELESETAVIRAEVRALAERGNQGFRPYVAQDSGTPQNKWTPLDQSLDWGALFLWEYGVRNEDACTQCPATVAALERVPQSNIPGRAPTAFFSLLRPRTHIPAHTGVTNIRTIIHLPLIVPAGCRFRVGGETRVWQEGEAFAFDDTIDHEAWNDSDELRAVLIFDVWNPYLSEAERRLIQLMFETSDATGLNPAVETGAGL